MDLFPNKYLFFLIFRGKVYLDLGIPTTKRESSHKYTAEYRLSGLNCSGNKLTGIDIGKQIPGNELVVHARKYPLHRIHIPHIKLDVRPCDPS